MEKNQSNVSQQWEVGQFVRTDGTLYEIISVQETGFDMQEIGTIEETENDEPAQATTDNQQ